MQIKTKVMMPEDLKKIEAIAVVPKHLALKQTNKRQSGLCAPSSDGKQLSEMSKLEFKLVNLQPK